MTLDRRGKILRRIDPRSQRGLEFGALNSPTVTPAEGQVRFVDFASTEELRVLRASDPTVNVADLVTVNYVWANEPLRELIGDYGPVDYVIASHVIEHVPDLIGWLREIADVLRPGGVASFVVPDKRYTFDRLRPVTRLPEVVEAYLHRRRKPSVRQIFEHYALHTRLDAARAWRGDVVESSLERVHDDAFALNVCRDAVASDKYVDSHCWVFTPQSFVELLRTLMELDVLPFRVAEFTTTAQNQIDFFVTLERLDDATDAAARRTAQLQSLPTVIDEPATQGAPPPVPQHVVVERLRQTAKAMLNAAPPPVQHRARRLISMVRTAMRDRPKA